MNKFILFIIFFMKYILFGRVLILFLMVFTLSLSSIKYVFAQIPKNKPFHLSPGSLEDFRVNDDPGNEDQNNPAVAYASDGSFLVVWEDWRSGTPVTDIYLQRYDKFAQAQGNNIKVNYNVTEIGNHYPSITCTTRDFYVVVWEGHPFKSYNYTDYDIYLQLYDRVGNVIGGNMKVNNDLTGFQQLYPAVASSTDGSFIVVWTDERNQDDWDIYLQHYNYSGFVLNGNIKVSDDTTGAEQSRPDIACAPDGSYIIVWEDNRNGNYDIYFQRLSSSGQAIGRNEKVYSNVSFVNQRNPSISASPDGSYVVVWQDDRYGNNEVNDIYLQRFNGSGQAIGNNIKVNSFGGHKESPVVYFASHGSFIVVWTDYYLDSPSPDIYAQKYTSNCTRIGSNFRVNNNTSSDQLSPDIAINKNDEIIFVWREGLWHPTIGFDIYAKIIKFDLPQISPDLSIPVKQHDFGQVTTVNNKNWQFSINNVGTDKLIIYDINWTENAFSLSDTLGIIQENASLVINVSFSPKEARSYIDTLKIYSNDPDSRVVNIVLTGEGIPQPISVLPNPFTPNDDGYNDYVEFKYPEMYVEKPVIQIFNIRGRKVREIKDFSDYDYRWYGKDDYGKELEPGVYIYILKIKGKRVSSGTITLIR